MNEAAPPEPPAPNAAVPSVASDEAPSEAATEAATETATEAATETVTEANVTGAPERVLGPYSVAEQPPLHVGKLKKGAMIAFFLVFGTLIGLANTIGENPLGGLRVATKFGMFSAPPKSQPIVVRGIPRQGRNAPPEVLTNPNEQDPDWRERLRDQRERKWHDNVGRAGGLQQGYLAYRCRVHGADYRKVQLVALADIGMAEKVILERNCAPLPPDAPRAAQ